MVKVKILSGPKKGQINLIPLQPGDLSIIANKGWRWKVDWQTVPETDFFEWVKYDMVFKIISCLKGGREVILQLPGEVDLKWSGNLSKVEIMEIENSITNSGYNVFVAEDSDYRLIIKGEDYENNIQ